MGVIVKGGNKPFRSENRKIIFPLKLEGSVGKEIGKVSDRTQVEIGATGLLR